MALMRLLLVACLAISLATASAVPTAFAAPAAQAMQTAQRLAKEALAAYRALDYAKATRLYADALRSVEHEDLFFMYGRSLEQVGQFAMAAFAYERSETRLKPGPVLAAVHARAGAAHRLDDAMRALAEARPADALAAARQAHAVLYAQSRRAEDGQVYPEPASALLVLARAEQAAGNDAGARQMLAEIRLDPTAPAAVLAEVARLSEMPAPTGAPKPPTPKPLIVEAPKPAPLVVAPKPTPVVEAPKPAPIAAPVAQMPIVERTAAPRSSLGPLLTIAGGVLALGTGAVFAWQSNQSWGEVQNARSVGSSEGCPAGGTCKAIDAGKAKDAGDRATWQGQAAWVGYGLGGAALVGGAMWYFLQSDDKPRLALAPTPSGIAWVGRF